IMTSNVGAPILEKEIAIGFRPVASEVAKMESAYERMKEHITEELRRTFRPEFLNRIDEVIVFRPLTSDQLKLIVNILISRVQRELRGQSMELEITEAAKDLLVKEGYDPSFGARPLRRAIQRLVEDQLSDELLRGSFSSGDTVLVDARENRLVFERKRKAEPALKGD
ncbi:MAG TPA: AAA family ATPase, partial [bacterium]|nr:AAA family ATPase [bacterium]